MSRSLLSIGRIATLIAVVCGLSACTFAQQEVQPQPSGEEDASEGSSVDAENASGVGVSIGPDGAQRIVSGSWTSLVVSGSNRTNEDTEETVVAWIGDDNRQQYARQFWIPAGAQRQTWLPIHVPDDLTGDLVTAPLKSIHLNEADGRESFRQNLVGMATSERSLLLSWEESRTAAMVISEERTAQSEEELLDLIAMIYAGRDAVVSGRQDQGIAQLGTTFLPPTAKALDSFDQIIIGNDHFLQDSSATDRLRGWLHDGGRLWVMVDRLPYESIVRLLGDRVPFTIVDRTQLNAFEHISAPPYPGAEESKSQWESELPADLVRVLTEADDIQSHIGDWPTAFWIPVGKGEVLFTTLSSDGWVSGEDPTTTYTSIANRFFIPKLQSARQSTRLIPYLQQEIGYRIPGRVVVAGVLGVHMLAVLACGIWFYRHESLHRLALVVPVASLLAAGALIALANQKTSAVASTIAAGQILRANPNSTQVRVDEVAAVYSQQARPLTIESGPNATTELLEEDRGELRRIVWKDSGQSEWQFVMQPPGAIRHVATESMITLDQPWSVVGTFDANGFRGQLTGIDQMSAEDAIVASAASPSMSVEFTSASNDRPLLVEPDHVLPTDQYIDATLMSDVQQARQSVLRQLISGNNSLVGREPVMLIWTEPVDSGVRFDADFEKVGTALAAVPISIHRPPGESSFTIPAGFLQLRSFAGQRGVSTVYNQQTGRWLESMNKSADVDLRALAPTSLLPFDLKRVKLEIKANAPGRTLTLSGFQDGTPRRIASQNSPAGVVTFVVDQEDMLTLDNQGGWRFSLAVSSSDEETRLSMQREAERERIEATQSQDPDEGSQRTSLEINEDRWRIEYVHLTFEGSSI